MMSSRSLFLSKCLGFAFAIFMTFMAANALAQAGTSSTYRIKKSVRNTQEFGADLGFDVKAINYSSASSVDNNFQQQAEISMEFKKEGLFFSDTKITIGTFSEPQSVYYAFPEAYVGYGDKMNAVTLGRKHENLSFADSFFHFGLIQPNFTNDTINYTEEGLTGITLHYFSSGVGFKVGYDPLFIPNQGPAVKAENGKITSSNRWAPAPPESFKFGDLNKEIVYAIRDYNVADIVNHAGFMGTVFFGESQTRPLLQFTYAQKPINELALSRDTFGDITTFKGYVYLTPIVLMHEVQAADLNLDSGTFKSTISMLSDKPVNQEAIELEAMQTLSPLSVVSVYAALDFSKSFDRSLEVYAAAASISGGEIKDVGRDGKEATFSFATGRTQFKKPVRFGVKGDMFYVFNEAVKADMNLTYDQKIKGSLMSVLIKYAASKSLVLNLGADLIGVENDTDDTQTNFLASNKANDRVFAGLSYVF